MREATAKTAKSATAALILTAAAIGLWGFAHRLYATLLPGLGPAFSLTADQAARARPAIVIGYLVMALPAAFVSRNLGFKIGMLFGLGTFAIGMFLVFPAVQQHSLTFFLISATVVGSGLAILEVTAVPLLAFLGRQKTAIQRTIFLCSLSPFGGLIALYLGPKILAHTASDPTAAAGIVALFSAVGAAAITLAFITELTQFPAVAAERVSADDRTLPSIIAPLRLPRFRCTIAGGFLILFAQIVIAGFAPLYCMRVMPSLTPAQGHAVLVCAYLALGLGRVAGPLLMYRIAPMRVAHWFAIASMVASLVSAATSGPVAIASLIATAFFCAVLYPTLFADMLLRLGGLAKSGAAVMMFTAFAGTGLLSLLTIAATPQLLPWIMLLPALAYGGTAAITRVLMRPDPAAGK